MPLDIAAFSEPRAFDAPSIGAVTVAVESSAFQSWAARGDSDARWTDGDAVMSALLKEQMRDAATGELIDAAWVDALTAETLEQIAEAMLASDHPVYGRLGRPLAEGEDAVPPTERIRNLVLSNAAKARELAQRAAADLERPKQRATDAISRAYVDTYRRYSAIHEAAERHERMMRSAFGVADGALYADRKVQELINASRATDPLFATGSVWRELDRHRELGLRATDLFADQGAALRTLALGRQWRELDSSAKLLALASGPSFFDDTSAYGLAMKTLGLGKTALALARLSPGAGFASPDVWQAVAGALRPGFQTAAWLGAGGTAPGASADLLAAYDADYDDDAPVFGEVVRSFRSLDDAPDTAVIEERVEKLVGAVTAKNRPRSALAKIGTVQMLSLVFGGLGTAFGGGSLVVAAVDLLAKTPEVEVNIILPLQEAGEQLQAEVEPDPALRYVHAKAWLRIGPDRTAQPIRAVYPDQPVRVLEAGDRWAKVEVYDYASERPIVGWISRPLLRQTPLGAFD